MQFQVASQLTWDGGDDVFLSGKRDVARLYEYWIFFIIFDIVTHKFEMDSKPVLSLIEKGAGGLSFQLKSGRSLNLLGHWRQGSASFRVRLSYNRTFSRKPNPRGDPERSYPNAGSWTNSMRPDYTLSIWPDHLSEDEAEAAESMVHLHFDAKYRVENVMDLFGEDDDELNDDKTAQKSAVARREVPPQDARISRCDPTKS